MKDIMLGHIISRREFKFALTELANGNEVYAQIVVENSSGERKAFHILSLETNDDYTRLFLTPITFDAPVAEIFSDEIDNNVGDLNSMLSEYTTEYLLKDKTDLVTFWILYRF